MNAVIPIVGADGARLTKSTCPYCGVGCGVIIESRGAVITGVRGDPQHPANEGRLCSKGSSLHLTAAPHIAQQVRLLQPQQRLQRGGPLRPLNWDTALDRAADRLSAIALRHGPDALGFYVSGQLLTEDYYAFNKLAKGLLGTNNIDTNSRLCMSSAVAGYKASLGADAPPANYADLALAQTVFIAGSNMAWAHPVLYRRLEDARRANPAQKWIVVDPRRTETAADADLHLQLQPGTDVALFHGLLHVMLWEGLTDNAFIAAHTQGFETLRDRVREFTPKHVAQTCGLKEADIVQAARWFSGAHALEGGGAQSAGGDGLGTAATGPARRPTLSLYCQGLNQSSSGTDKNQALINLHLATGQIGRPGAGPMSLTGQPNAMGGREVGGLANQLSAHRDLANPQHRAEVAALWGVRDVPALPGKAAIEMFQAAADGEIRALWIVCTNPAQSLPDQTLVRRALERAEFVVLQEAYAHTATAAYADLLLPATTWGEKDGTVTNSERRISRQRAAVPAPGEARHDWAIAVGLAQRLEERLPSRRAQVAVASTQQGATPPSLLPYTSAEQIWLEHRESTRGRDLDITGLSWAQLDEAPAQWPWPEGALQGRARLYEDHHFATPDGRAKFAAPAWRNVAEPRDARYPVALNTGRLRDQWHGMSRTGTLGRLFGHAGEPCIEMHPQELTRRGWQAGELLRVQSRRAALVLPVQPSLAVAPAQAHIAMHWGSEYVGGHNAEGQPHLGVNALTSSARCAVSGQPELKHAAVRLERAGLPWQLLAVAWLPADQALRVRERLRSLWPHFGYISVVPFGPPGAAVGLDGVQQTPSRTGLLLRAAALNGVGTGVLKEIEVALGLNHVQTQRYVDARRGQLRLVRLAAPADAVNAAQAPYGASAATGTNGPSGGDGALVHPDGLDAFMLVGDLASQAWLLGLLQSGAPARALGAALLSARRQAPAALAAAPSPQICSCWGVSEAAVQQGLAHGTGTAEERLQGLQARLRCGTECGSCLPALKALVRQSMPAAATTEATATATASV